MVTRLAELPVTVRTRRCRDEALTEDLVDEPARADQQGNPSVGLVDAASNATAVLTVGDRAEV
jgi:hypothetical protein